MAPGICLIIPVKCSAQARLIAGIMLDQIEVVPLQRNI
jgi:hypothetical protein